MYQFSIEERLPKLKAQLQELRVKWKSVPITLKKGIVDEARIIQNQIDMFEKVLRDRNKRAGL